MQTRDEAAPARGWFYRILKIKSTHIKKQNYRKKWRRKVCVGGFDFNYSASADRKYHGVSILSDLNYDWRPARGHSPSW